MKLSEIDATLREIRVSPVKTLGQNFLHDGNLARWIVEKAELTPEDYVVEIGPGLGALTQFILASGARVLAIEKDRRLADFLRKRFSSERCEILHADALDFDVRQLFAQPRVKLLGNLPYYISSQLLLKFTEISESYLFVVVHVTKGDGAADFRVARHERLRRAYADHSTSLSRGIFAHCPGERVSSAARC